MNYPKTLWRSSDGEPFDHTENGIYIMRNSRMAFTYEYPYHTLIDMGFMEHNPTDEEKYFDNLSDIEQRIERLEKKVETINRHLWPIELFE